MSAVPAASAHGVAPVNHRIAVFLTALALGCSLAAFAGWLFGVPELRSFGFVAFPVYPWTALGFVALALGFLASLHGRPRLAVACWAVPLLIAAVMLLQGWTGADFGVDRLLFPHQLAQYAFPHPGRTGINPITVYILLTLAGIGANLRNRLSDEMRSLVATIALGLAAAATILILFSRPGNRDAPLFSSSLPAAIVTMALALAVITRNSGFDWVRALFRDRANRNVLRILLPAALLLPLFPAVLELIVVDQSTLSPIAGELLVVVCNVLVVATVAYWAITRVAREHAAQVALSRALDVTTVALTTLDGRITHWSQGAEQLYGWTAAEAQGQHKYALLRSRCESSESALPRRGLDDDSQELVEISRDGREIAVLERVHRVETPGRDPLLVLKMTDISDRARAVVDLRESEERLATATATHQVGVFEWDAASGKFNWSPGTEQRLGLAPGSLADYPSWAAQVEPADVEEVNQTIARAVADRADRFSFRYRFLQPNGGVRAVEGSARTFYDAGGNLQRTVGAILDITEREEREAALRRREAQLRSIIETVPDAMLVIDDEGTIRVFSATAEALWGYRAQQVLGHHFTMLSAPRERARHTAKLQQYLKTGRWNAGEMISATGQAADGRRFPVEIRAGVARVDGRLLFTLFARDITERLEAEERLGELNAELAHVSRQIAMSELAADMAHELNQPLSASANFLAAARMLIDKGEDLDRIGELLRMASEQTLRAGEIIRRLRSFTMRGEVDMREEPLAATIRDAVELVLVGTSQFHIRLSYDLDPQAPVIFADRIQIQQVLVNLLRNSVEVLRQTGGSDRRIMIRSTKLNGQIVEIEIADNGPGIPEPILGQLFSRFTTTKREGRGMGIGLSISKRIIEAHGGTLSAENRPDGGAAFRFTLAAVEQGGG